jgi:hypothetical protein
MSSSTDNFIPEMETMDLSSLKNKTFAVAISSGPRDDKGFLPSTLRGSFNYLEMIDYVFNLWSTKADNAKVLVLNKSLSTKLEWLDAKTIDYIIEKAPLIIMEDMLLLESKFTCTAGLVEDSEENK